MQICLIRRQVNRESGRFGASGGINIPDLYTYEGKRSGGCMCKTHCSNAWMFWIVKRAHHKYCYIWRGYHIQCQKSINLSSQEKILRSKLTTFTTARSFSKKMRKIKKQLNRSYYSHVRTIAIEKEKWSSSVVQVYSTHKCAQHKLTLFIRWFLLKG